MNFDDSFHRHLDICKRCREEPFNLCPTGRTLLEAQVEQNADELRRHDPRPQVK